jgi:hypothetical protein
MLSERGMAIRWICNSGLQWRESGFCCLHTQKRIHRQLWDVFSEQAILTAVWTKVDNSCQRTLCMRCVKPSLVVQTSPYVELVAIWGIPKFIVHKVLKKLRWIHTPFRVYWDIYTHHRCVCHVLGSTCPADACNRLSSVLYGTRCEISAKTNYRHV